MDELDMLMARIYRGRVLKGSQTVGATSYGERGGLTAVPIVAIDRRAHAAAAVTARNMSYHHVRSHGFEGSGR
jgi:hypothetical protein